MQNDRTAKLTPINHRDADAPYRGKRLLDLAILALVAMPAAMVGVVCGLAVRLTSRGPVFFRQERIGINGRPFEVWKFRTMVAGDNPIFPDATRITRVGAVLRRLSLDELPQLINVARGEMSVVGPRPTLAYQVERYDSHQRRRLAVRPGLTGLAQVSGRNSLTWSDRIEFDIEYVESQSVVTDLRLVFKTISTILTGDGVEGHPGNDPLARVSATGASAGADGADGAAGAAVAGAGSPAGASAESAANADSTASATPDQLAAPRKDLP